MDTFRTHIKIEPGRLQIGHQDPSIFMGSCFAANIGSRMESLRFNTLVNPFGVLFNPSSVAESLRLLLEEKQFHRDNLEHPGELWFSFSHHGSFSNPDPDVCLDKINKQLKLGSEKLLQCRFLILTFGTSWIYRYKKTGKIVANCHKLPESEFDRLLLDQNEIALEFSALIKQLQKQIPHLNIVLTVSPVRHLRDGMEGNQISKAILHLAVKQIQEENLNCHYFPAYEIMMDDLRDYRFYEEDMIHPNKLAIDYIWNRFADAYFSRETQIINTELEKLMSAMNHRPLHPGGKEFKLFCAAQLKIIKQIQAKYPFLTLDSEEVYFSKSL